MKTDRKVFKWIYTGILYVFENVLDDINFSEILLFFHFGLFDFRLLRILWNNPCLHICMFAISRGVRHFDENSSNDIVVLLLF